MEGASRMAEHRNGLAAQVTDRGRNLAGHHALTRIVDSGDGFDDA
jgi:hypothetical protein